MADATAEGDAVLVAVTDAVAETARIGVDEVDGSTAAGDDPAAVGEGPADASEAGVPSADGSGEDDSGDDGT